jgi:Protein of unknown function (DUF3152).
MRLKISTILLAGLLSCMGLISANVLAVKKNDTNTIFDNLTSLQALPIEIGNVKSPELKNPDWLQTILDAEHQSSLQTCNSKPFLGRVVTYSVEMRGVVTADIGEFKTQAAQTYNDRCGWSRLGISFQEVASGGDFSLVLSEANQLPIFSSGCTADWSCRVGRYVVINQDRWLGASSAWNVGGGSLRDYRNMVINHETGHWLGHDHLYCGGAGQLAPLMQQQSIDLQGCSFNPWPLDSELWSSQLGI